MQNSKVIIPQTFIRAISQRVYATNKGLSVASAVAVASALNNAIDYIEQAHFTLLLNEGLQDVVLTSNGVKIDFDSVDVMAILEKADLFVLGQTTKTFKKLFEESSRYMPIVKGGNFVRRFKNSKRSKLMIKSITTLESTYSNIDETMLTIANQVFKTDLIINDEEYVINACNELVLAGNLESFSEFKEDKRERLYQACCHGANGQSSDMARALQNLVGVPQDYDIDKAREVLLDEMGDMVKGNVRELFKFVKHTGSVNVIRQALSCKGSCKNHAENKLSFPLAAKIKKPWSFVKACFILDQLDKGGRPYIGMAFGLDAKCSGVQLGSLMTGDQNIASACGFGLEKALYDAYELAINLFTALGLDVKLIGLTRDLIKKAFMGIFYGQGKRAFQDASNFNMKGQAENPKKHAAELLDVIKALGAGITDSDKALQASMLELGIELDIQLIANGRLFHETVESSFGNMVNVRRAFKAVHGEYVDGEIQYYTSTKKPVSHFMPDGSIICMNEKVSYNILNEPFNHEDDNTIDVDGITIEGFKLGTEEIDRNYQLRTGFVNLIQGTDALLARLIIANLAETGAKHVIAVHDCFRVNICDMISGKLHDAIELAYAQIFTDLDCKWFVRKFDDINPKDILANYFRGVQLSYNEHNATRPVIKKFNQFIGNTRKFQSVYGNDIKFLCFNLENKITNNGKKSYFFAK